jgi:hypothetical protein
MMRALRALLLSTVGVALLANVSSSARAGTPVAITYVPNSLAESSIAGGPWTLHQAVGRNAHDASGILPTIGTPFSPQTTAFGTPYKNYCVAGKLQPARGVNPMQPYYFPFVRSNGDELEGFFDYRPRNEQEATVAAISRDGGKSWRFEGEVLRLNPFCPADPTDPDNNNVTIDGVSTPYGSDPNSAADNGLGHAFVMTLGGVERIYHLNRANNHIDHDPLVVHMLTPRDDDALAGLPDFGYVSSIGSRGYPTLDATAQATVGLQNPDAILGATKIDGVTTVVYVAKQLGGAPDTPVLTPEQTCPMTPSFALTTTSLASREKRTPISSPSVSPRRPTASISTMSAPRAASRTRPASPSMLAAGLAAAASFASRTAITACSSARATASTMIPMASTSSAMPRRSTKSTARRICCIGRLSTGSTIRSCRPIRSLTRSPASHIRRTRRSSTPPMPMCSPWRK